MLPWYMRQPSVPAKSMPRSRASSDAFGPKCSLASGYRSRWWTQKRKGSMVAHWKSSGIVCSTGSAVGSAMGPAYDRARRRPPVADRPRSAPMTRKSRGTYVFVFGLIVLVGGIALSFLTALGLVLVGIGAAVAAV